MGWWKIRDGEGVIGDPVADILDEALDRICWAYLEEFHRFPTAKEIQSIYEFSSGGLEETVREEISTLDQVVQPFQESVGIDRYVQLIDDRYAKIISQPNAEFLKSYRHVHVYSPEHPDGEDAFIHISTIRSVVENQDF